MEQQKSRLDIQDQEVWVNILFKDPETGNYLKGFVYQKFLSKQGGIIADNRYFEVYNTYQDQNEPYLILNDMPEVLAWKGMGAAAGGFVGIISRDPETTKNTK